jgi:hypothetical protein
MRRVQPLTAAATRRFIWPHHTSACRSIRIFPWITDPSHPCEERDRSNFPP